MATYRRGSMGPEVKHIQEKLRDLGFYNGPLDGDFGGGTEQAVRLFQMDERLSVDGLVGPNTWKALFGKGKIPVPALHKEPLDVRCLALTAAFESGHTFPECFCALTGDFDGQGISFGVLQWNLGQRSLQPMLERMCADHADVTESVFGPRVPELKAMLEEPLGDQLAWARSIQDARRRRLEEPWNGLFKSLGRTQEYQEIQRQGARTIFDSAVNLAKDYGLGSQRGVALMFDIRVQNGSIPGVVRVRIERAVGALPESLSKEESEVERMKIIANLRAEASRAQYVEDVRSRKLTIAEGRGRVHGRAYNLEDDFNITMKKASG
jgi:hypothetical protein